MFRILEIPHVEVNSETVTVVRIFVGVGDPIEVGSEVANFETLKTNFSMESDFKGYVREILIQEGDECRVLSPAFLLTAEADTPVTDEMRALVKSKVKPASGVIALGMGEVRPTTAKARILAKKYKLDLSKIQAGPQGVVTQKEVEAFAKSHSIVQKFLERKMTNQERGMLLSIEFSKREAIPAFLERVVEISEFARFAQKNKTENGYFLDPSFPLLAWFFVECLKKHPTLNSMASEDKIFQFESINLGFTIDVQGDLLIATVQKAEQFTQKAFVEEVFDIMKRAQKKDLRSSELSGATVGITSLAAQKITMHQPILPPNTSIMLAHSANLPYSTPEKIYTTLGVTYDHRVHTGMKIARLLEQLVRYLQNPGG